MFAKSQTIDTHQTLQRQGFVQPKPVFHKDIDADADEAAETARRILGEHLPAFKELAR